jgi:hypothetical protein
MESEAMKTTTMVALGALFVSGVMVAATPLQDAAAHGQDKPAQGMDPMVEACIKAGTPGPQHAEFKEVLGTWSAKVKHYMPGQPVSETTGTSRYEMMLGDRYLVERHKGEVPGVGPFEGMGIMAYNNVTGEYQHIWMDSMSTGIFMSSGKPGEDGSCTMRGQMDDPMTGKKLPCRMTMETLGEDQRHFEMYCEMDGTESKMMEITYTRGTGTR